MDERVATDTDGRGRQELGVEEPGGLEGARRGEPDGRDPARGLEDAPTYLSLFSGIGGLDLAVEHLGFRCVGQVEWDGHCTRVLERWWPAVPRWGDVTGFGAAAYARRRGMERRSDSGVVGDETRAGAGEGLQRERRRDADRGADPDARVDLICGGFPCQPASTAGRRKGTADDRWLWPEFARVVGELGPRYVVVENVPGLLTVNGGRAFSEVLGDLASLGYDATWRSVRASEVGAPHRRERIFLLARYAGESGLEGAAHLRRGTTEAGGDAPHADHGRHESFLRSPSLTGVHTGEAGSEPRGAGGRVASDAEDADGRIGGAGEPTGTGIRGRGPGSAAPFTWGPYEPAIRRWERTLNRPAPNPVDDKGRLAPPFVEFMMGFPEGWTDRMTRTQALKALGNAVVPQQGAAALAALLSMATIEAVSV